MNKVQVVVVMLATVAGLDPRLKGVVPSGREATNVWRG